VPLRLTEDVDARLKQQVLEVVQGDSAKCTYISRISSGEELAFVLDLRGIGAI
jgi:hypothetical protein